MSKIQILISPDITPAELVEAINAMSKNFLAFGVNLVTSEAGKVPRMSKAEHDKDLESRIETVGGDADDAPQDPDVVLTERDSAGTPWDERIHASTRSVTKDGVWTRRRHVSELDYNKVFKEIMASTKAPEGTPTPTPSKPTPPKPGLPKPAASKPTPPPKLTAFQSLAKEVASLLDAKAFDESYLDTLTEHLGLGTFESLAGASEDDVLGFRNSLKEALDESDIPNSL